MQQLQRSLSDSGVNGKGSSIGHCPVFVPGSAGPGPVIGSGSSLRVQLGQGSHAVGTHAAPTYANLDQEAKAMHASHTASAPDQSAEPRADPYYLQLHAVHAVHNAAAANLMPGVPSDGQALEATKKQVSGTSGGSPLRAAAARLALPPLWRRSDKATEATGLGVAAVAGVTAPMHTRPPLLASVLRPAATGPLRGGPAGGGGAGSARGAGAGAPAQLSVQIPEPTPRGGKGSSRGKTPSGRTRGRTPGASSKQSSGDPADQSIKGSRMLDLGCFEHEVPEAQSPPDSELPLRLRNAIFTVTWQVAQLFGFQTFNEGPQPPAPPAGPLSSQAPAPPIPTASLREAARGSYVSHARSGGPAAAGSAGDEGSGAACAAGAAGAAGRVAGSAGAALGLDAGVLRLGRGSRGVARARVGHDHLQPLSERCMLNAMGAGSASTGWDTPCRPGDAAEGPQINGLGGGDVGRGGEGSARSGGVHVVDDLAMRRPAARCGGDGEPGEAAKPVVATKSAATPGQGATAAGPQRPPKRLWVPATAFVASDHLMHLLRDSVLRMHCQAGHPEPMPAQYMQQDREDRMLSRALYELHDNIFHSYATQWSKLVGLQPWPSDICARRHTAAVTSPEARHMLLCDLALYFLLWTEAANTRHMPEVMWFLYWCCCHSYAYIQYHGSRSLGTAPLQGPPKGGAGQATPPFALSKDQPGGWAIGAFGTAGAGPVGKAAVGAHRPAAFNSTAPGPGPVGEAAVWAGQAPVTGASAMGTAAGAAAGTVSGRSTTCGFGNNVPLGLSMDVGGQARHAAAGFDAPLSLGGDVEADVRALMVHCRHHFQGPIQAAIDNIKDHRRDCALLQTTFPELPFQALPAAYIPPELCHQKERDGEAGDLRGLSYDRYRAKAFLKGTKSLENSSGALRTITHEDASGAAAFDIVQLLLTQPMQPGADLERVVDTCAELAAVGDGGFWCERIITPLFLLLVQEIEILGAKKEDHMYRLGYDDVNESFTHREQVQNALRLLGVTQDQLASSSPNTALSAIAVWIGSPFSPAGSGQPPDPDPAKGSGFARFWGRKPPPTPPPPPSAPSPTLPHFAPEARPRFVSQARSLPPLSAGIAAAPDTPDGGVGGACCFVPERATAFWSLHVTSKTFMERRTLWAVFRVYFRVFMLNMVAFHLLMAKAVSDAWDVRVLSTVVITHSGLVLLERFATLFISLQPLSKYQKKHAAKYADMRQRGVLPPAALDFQQVQAWRQQGQQQGQGEQGQQGQGQGQQQGEAAAAAAAAMQMTPPVFSVAPLDFKVVRVLRRKLAIEGAPLWGVLCAGFTEWLLTFITLLTVYIVQLSLKTDALILTWDVMSATYVGLVALHFLLTTRPGHCISLSHSRVVSYLLPGPLLRIIRASSCRPNPTYWLIGDLSMPVLGADRSGWMRSLVTWGVTYAAKLSFEYFLVCIPLSKELQKILAQNNCPANKPHCLDIRWPIAIATAAPFVLLCLVDGMIFYHAWLTLVRISSHLLRLNYAAQPSWGKCVSDFTSIPDGWWKRCMSPLGRDNAHVKWDEPFPVPPHIEKAAVTTEGGRTVQVPKLGSGGAMNESFAYTWNEVIDDLRQADLLSDAEHHNCKYSRLSDQCHDSGWLNAWQHVSTLSRPAFFYAGQVRRCLESGRTSKLQASVLVEFKSLAILLASELRLISSDQADALQAAEFGFSDLSELTFDVRLQMLQTAQMVAQELNKVLRGETGSNAKGCVSQMQTLVQGVKSKLLLPLQGGQQDDRARQALTALHDCLKDSAVIQSQAPKLKEPSATSKEPSATQLSFQIVEVLHVMLITNSRDVAPRSEEARRIISVFLNSLGLKRLYNAPSVLEGHSLTTLTPVFSEEVINSQGKLLAGVQLKDGSSGGSGSDSNFLTFVQGIYSNAWDNFRERVFRMAKRHQASGEPITRSLEYLLSAKEGWRVVDEKQFAPGGPLAPWLLDLQLWASMRGQVLARTTRGMMCTERALRVLCAIEYPRPQGMPLNVYRDKLTRLAHTKFTYLVSAQLYGQYSASKKEEDQWHKTAVDVLMATHAALRVAFLAAPNVAEKKGQCSVLLRYVHGDPEGSGKAAGRPVEMYRVRLPYSPGRAAGVVIGPGKPENQNQAVVFAFGQAMQAIDMNQDNNLAEALKMRNVLARLAPTTHGKEVKPPKSFSLTNVFNPVFLNDPSFTDQDSDLFDPSEGHAPAHRRDFNLNSKVHRGDPRGSWSARLDLDVPEMGTVQQQLDAYCLARSGAVFPTVIVGFKEFPLSEKAGALARFAAATEYAFATIVQKDMTKGHVRLHYGHPDVFDKLHVMTRGGVSKSTRGLHVSEDVMAGLNHTLRGGSVAYMEAVSCGKGRDTGFDSVLIFEAKVSAGNGEVFLTRDMLRLTQRMDLFRLLHFYHSGLGYFTTARLLLLNIYVQAFCLAIVAISGYSLVNSNLQLLIQIGLVSSLPYAAQLIFERGFIFACIEFFQQLVAGMVPFSFFRMQTTAYSFFNDIMYGGASYMPTGRGFSYTPTSWIVIWCSYGRSHIYLGFELGLLLVVLASTGAAGAEYGGLTWGIWLVSASLVFAPYWFNPFGFALDVVQSSWRMWQAWLAGEVLMVDVEGTEARKGMETWTVWHRAQLANIRNDDGKQENRWMTVLLGLGLNTCPHLLMALAAAHQLTVIAEPLLLLSLLLTVVVITTLLVRANLPKQHRSLDIESADATLTLGKRMGSNTTARTSMGGGSAAGGGSVVVGGTVVGKGSVFGGSGGWGWGRLAKRHGAGGSRTGPAAATAAAAAAAAAGYDRTGLGESTPSGFDAAAAAPHLVGAAYHGFGRGGNPGYAGAVQGTGTPQQDRQRVSKAAPPAERTSIALRTLDGFLVVLPWVTLLVFAVTMGQLGGTSAFFLSLYIQLCTIMALHSAALHLCPSESTAGRIVDKGFWILDCLCGSILLGIVAILSTARILGRIHTVLLFDRKVASAFRNAGAARTFARVAHQGTAGFADADAMAPGADSSAQSGQGAGAQSGEKGAAGAAQGGAGATATGVGPAATLSAIPPARPPAPRPASLGT